MQRGSGIVRAARLFVFKSAAGVIGVGPPRLLHPARSGATTATTATARGRRGIGYSARRLSVKPFLLADIGEGIRECEVIQWFVEPGARVEQFDKLCEVQSDKASVEITSRYDGVIKKLHYEAGDMAIVGKPLVDIDLQGDIKDAEQLVEVEDSPGVERAEAQQQQQQRAAAEGLLESVNGSGHSSPTPSSSHGTLATPAVRRLTREHDIDISKVSGTGKDGRVLKEDVTGFVRQQLSNHSPRQASGMGAEERKLPLTPIQAHMFKAMTKSLSIPHFLYSDEVDFDALIRLRSTTNKSLESVDSASKVSYLPFIIKAVSIALGEHPLLNSRLEFEQGDKPVLVMRPQHNIGVAMDTPAGLLVPNVKDVANLSVLGIAAELNRLQAAGQEGKLTPADLRGGTMTVSNIGNIGGTVVAPVIVPGEVAILGMGRARKLPRFDRQGVLVVPKTVITFSWSADHRVVDGATMARMAALVRNLVEEPELMLARMK